MHVEVEEEACSLVGTVDGPRVFVRLCNAEVFQHVPVHSTRMTVDFAAKSGP